MKINLSVSFKVLKDKVICFINYDGKCFKGFWGRNKQAEGIDEVRRAKEMAYTNCMAKLHGYVCDKKIY